MILIDTILISDEIVKNSFACAIDKCKGACCWEGDFGAPLEKKEIKIIEKILEDIKPYLDPLALSRIEEKGWKDKFGKKQFDGTQLMDDGACVFLQKDKNGIANCSFEIAHKDGKTDFKKPISCHLYPVRAEKNDLTGFEALNYDEWDICAAACKKGKAEGIPIYKFVKDALIRKYGEDFYERLNQIANSPSNK